MKPLKGFKLDVSANTGFQKVFFSVRCLQEGCDTAALLSVEISMSKSDLEIENAGSSLVERLERQVKYVSSVVNGRCPFIAELSCYHPGSFQTPEKMITGARTAIDNGADGIGIYRSHGVAQLNYWPVLEEMSKL